ncbi:ethanolaminephosphotransferase, putative [Ixodes scapularis]|uniref:Ethanolaminephosphotransferase, putative n=2 Tax=Ixodes scapularis TaxID=6945 RepID=B7QL98_IXOSC|nr:ethanolaminephosphotransferase, putative [Ixodes scapularis]|eukprot:XP_002415953.1 ethanolaminephosphotransferase, putative [Ixodes scapularis]
MESHPVMFLVTFGFAFAKLTIRLVLTTVSFGEVDLWDSSLVAPLFLCLHLLLSATSMSLPVSSALMGSMVYSVMDFARFFTYASWDIRDALDVWIFSVKYPVGDPRCKNGNNGLYLNGLNNDELLKKARLDALNGAKKSLLKIKQNGQKLGLSKALAGCRKVKKCLN